MYCAMTASYYMGGLLAKLDPGTKLLGGVPI
jgi:hypothetical protein